MTRYIPALLLLLGSLGLAQEPVTTIQAHVDKPARLTPTAARVSSLKLPAGFRIDVFAEGLGKPRILVAAPDGTVYVSRREPGDCWMLKDTNGDGRADVRKRVAVRKDLHGLALRGDKLYLTTIKEVFVAARRPDGTLGPLRQIMGNLPDGGQHPNRTLAFGPDGKLYLSVGSTCNAQTEPNPESATLLVAQPDGSRRRVFASGLRNTIGFAWHPVTQALFGADHGIDWLGDDSQPEELNLLQEGQRYGWPYVYADGRLYPATEPPAPYTKEQWRAMSRNPQLLFTAHSAPMQLVFYTGQQFPAEYRNDAFLTMHGSWNRQPPSGYELLRVHFENGKPVSAQPFLTGFLTPEGQFGRPVGLVQWLDGSVLMSDDDHGRIYRISYSN